MIKFIIFIVAFSIILLYLVTLLKSKHKNIETISNSMIRTDDTVVFPTLMPLKLTDIATQKEGYSKLINLCLAEQHKLEVTRFINTLKDYNGDHEYMTTLNFVIEYLANKGIHFIISLDWKQDIQDLYLLINASLKDNFNESIELPNPDFYGKNKSISYKNVFIDFDKTINKYGFKLGFIHTDADEYVIVVHKTTDEKDIERAINMIGYNYLTAISPMISPQY